MSDLLQELQNLPNLDIWIKVEPDENCGVQYPINNIYIVNGVLHLLSDNPKIKECNNKCPIKYLIDAESCIYDDSFIESDNKNYYKHVEALKSSDICDFIKQNQNVIFDWKIKYNGKEDASVTEICFAKEDKSEHSTFPAKDCIIIYFTTR